MLPQLADWFQAWEAEAWLEAGEPAAAAHQPDVPSTSPPARAWRAIARARAWLALGDTDLGLARLRREAERFAADGDGPELAAVLTAEAQLLAASGRPDEARRIWRAIANDPRLPPTARAHAADRLAEWPHRDGVDEAARSFAYEAAGRADAALAAWRAALALGVPADEEALLRLGRLALVAGDPALAREAFRDAQTRLRDPDAQADAARGAARARARGGDRRGAREELRAVLTRWPTTAAAGTAAFLLGDLAPTRVEAVTYYAKAARIPTSPFAAEALVRLGDRRLDLGDLDGALTAWQEYLRRYPRGETAARIAYRGARALSRAGRAAEARRWYETALASDPLSYYAMRAADRLGVDHLADALVPRPWVGLAEEANLARELLDRLAALDSLGASDPWRQEFEAATRRLRTRPLATIVLAEGLRASHPVEAIRLARALIDVRAQPWDRRLLLVTFPFLYRDLIEDEARRAGVDPYLLAGLIRQESSFRPDARSWAGARGLTQILPSTGAWLAQRTLPVPWDPDLLFVAEINVRMGAIFLADLLRRYDGRVDYALAAYNAGPGRVDRWRRFLPSDPDGFREAIPIAETRQYVQVVLRNQEVYRRLYGE
jgi:soluble lytic murein transglycosylase